MIRFLTMPPANDLFSHPIRWAGKHLALYATAAAISGAAFVAGSAIYVRLVPAATTIQPSPNPWPLKVDPAADPVDPKFVPLDDEKNTPLVARGESGIPIFITIGAQVLDVNRKPIGNIKDVTLTSVGEAKVDVLKLDGKLVTLPAEGFVWNVWKPTNGKSATASTSIGNYKVEAVAKKAFQQLQ